MNGSGKGGDNRGSSRRRPFKNRERGNAWQDASKGGDKKSAEAPKWDGLHERPRWIAPKPPAEPLPAVSCAWCGEPIQDISTAMFDTVGRSVHFECALARISENETLGPGDAVTYIGGGRFGIIHYNNPPDTKDFKIKRIFEWENKEHYTEWRKSISDYFSVT